MKLVMQAARNNAFSFKLLFCTVVKTYSMFCSSLKDTYMGIPEADIGINLYESKSYFYLVFYIKLLISAISYKLILLVHCGNLQSRPISELIAIWRYISAHFIVTYRPLK